MILQFRGAFKRFVKSRNEKELERRWTRINRQSLRLNFKHRNNVDDDYDDDDNMVEVANENETPRKIRKGVRSALPNKVQILKSMSSGCVSSAHSSSFLDYDFRSMPSNLNHCKYKM